MRVNHVAPAVAIRAGLAFLCSGVALAAPSLALGLGEAIVNENQGTLRYEYRFDLPSARGRYQPAVTISYDSSAEWSSRWIPYRWELNWGPDVIPDFMSGSPPTRFFFGTERDKKPLVASSRDPGWYSVDVEDDYFVLRQVDDRTWEGRDATGTTFTFAALGVTSSATYKLSRVVDRDGNVTKYEFDGGRLTRVLYNAFNVPSDHGAKSQDAPFATVIDFEYPLESRYYLRNIRVRNRASPTAETFVTLRRYEFELSSYEVGYPPDTITNLDAITEVGGEDGILVPPTRFEYAGSGWTRSSHRSERVARFDGSRRTSSATWRLSGTTS